MPDTTPLGANQVIKYAAEALTVLAIASYAIGFIIVNSYLLTFGYSGNALFKTVYIGAGILFLLLITPIALPLYSFFLRHHWAKDTPQDSASRIRFNIVKSLGLPALVAYYLLKAIGSKEIYASYEESPWWMLYISILSMAMVLGIVMMILEHINLHGKLAVWAKKYNGLSSLILYFTILSGLFKIEVIFCLAAVTFAVFMGMVFFLDDQSIMHRLRDSPSEVATHLAGILVLSLFSIGLFGTTVYGHIKPQYGGGQPARVRVLIAEEKMNTLSLRGGLRNMQTLLAETQLIDSTEKELLLLLKSTHGDKGVLLQVDRSIVEAVLYLPSPP